MKWIPFCRVCYSCHLSPRPVSKKDAERIAASHMRAYSHDTGIIPA
mgnify:CR=1 FL=1